MCAEVAAAGDFDEGGEFGHDDGDGDVEESPVPREAEGVVAGGGGDDAAAGLGGGELGEGVAGAAFFEAAGALEVFLFAVDLGAGEFAEGGRGGARGVDDGAVEAGAGGDDLGEWEGGGCGLRARGRVRILRWLTRRAAGRWFERRGAFWFLWSFHICIWCW